MPPTIYDVRGNIIQNSTVGHPVVISKNFTNNRGNEIDFMLLIEVRDESGITQYLAWQTGRASPMTTRNAGVSWTPNSVGEYQIRTFAISNLTNPQVLDVVETAQFSVFEPERERKVYSLELDGRKYDIEYALGSGYIREIVVEQDISTLLLHLSNVSKNTVLVIKASKELLFEAFSCGIEPPPRNLDYDVEGFVDTITMETLFRLGAPEWEIPLEAGSRQIEFAGTCLA